MSRKMCVFAMMVLALALALVPSVHAEDPIRNFVVVQGLPDSIVAGRSYEVVFTFDSIAPEPVPFSFNLKATCEKAPLDYGEVLVNGFYLNGGNLLFTESGPAFFQIGETTLAARSSNELRIVLSTVINLMPGTYVFEIRYGTEWVVIPMEPTYAPPSDTTPPMISDVKVTNITETSATITWKTDENSTSRVEYDSSTAENKTLVKLHRIVLADLEPETAYLFKVASRDGAGNEAVSEEYSFTTLSPPPPNEVVEEVPANQIGYVVDASDLAGTKVTLDTVAPVTVTILRYEVNPHPGDPLPATALPRYVDVSVSDPDAVVWPIYVEMTYTSAEVGSLDESSLGIYYWIDGAWHRCSNTGVDMERNIVWAYMTEEEASGSPILIGGTPPPSPKPAEFVLSGLIITGPHGEIGEAWIEKSVAVVTINLLVTNVGDLEGSTTVDLLVNGVKEQSKPVTLAGGASTMVSFSISKTTAGTYAVKVGDLTGSFTVMKTPTPAAFTFTGLVVSPADVAPGAEVTVSVTVKNTGEQSGTYSAELKLDGETKETKTGTLAGGISTTVTFKVSSQAEGTHTVQVGTQTGSFTVTAPTVSIGLSPAYIAGILIILAVAVASIYILYKSGRLPLHNLLKSTP